LDANAASRDLQRYAMVGMSASILLAAALIVVLFLGNDRQRRQTIQALADQEERFRALAQYGADLVSVLDRDGIVRYQSPSITSILGRDPGEVVGHPLSSLLHVDDGHNVERLIEGAIRGQGTPYRAELRMLHEDGGWRIVEAVAVNLMDNPRVRGVVVTSRDVTDRKHLAEQLSHMAFHDSLTGLPNRALYMDRLAHALKRTQRSGESVAVLFIDLDGFKRVNDTLGHDAGDALLKIAAERVRTSVRPADTVARLGGDEFTIVLDGADADAAGIVARRLATRLAEPVPLEGQLVTIGASIGVSVKDHPADQPDDLLRRADAAMYQAKQAGKGRYVVFDYAATAESEVMGVAR
jgi:diguanylate cyclase (GGDEF)-like protein/PAS domain S-box-containing protein